MFLERIRTDGLAHFSYMVGDAGQAAVIDPQRDIERYLELAQREDVRIAWIYETHRNEDFVSGARALAQATGAEVLHGPDPAGALDYATIVRGGEERRFGSVCLRVIETPGHTDDSISIALFDEEHASGAAAVFTGDALFVGDVGRTDFYPDRAREVAGLLYDSLTKLMALGDQAILCPAHGAGSVCGGGMADREFSTIGHERRNNPRLQLDTREAFIEAKLAEHHYQPPYFRLMERLNLEGAPACAARPVVTPLTLEALRGEAPDWTLDIRPVSAYLGAHLPGTVSLPLDMIASYAGWFLSETSRIGLVCGGIDEAETAARQLCRIGFERIVGASSGLVEHVAAGSAFETLPAVDTQTVRERIGLESGWSLLDVRSVDEFQAGHIEGSRHVYAGEVLRDPACVQGEGPLTVLCASGARATLAAAALKHAGRSGVDVYLGSTGAWTAAGYELAT